MNWRRGLLLAGINLAVAVPLIVMQEAQHETYMQEHSGPPPQLAGGPAQKTASPDEDDLAEFSPCDMTADYPDQVLVVQWVNLPAFALSGWWEQCPAHWTLSGMLHVGYSWPTRATMPLSRGVAAGFGSLIVVQWILVGAFPLVHPKRWWLEPGAFITCCAVIAFGLVWIRPIEGIARLPGFFAVLAWFWWLGLLLWKCARSGWRLVTRRRAIAS